MEKQIFKTVINSNTVNLTGIEIGGNPWFVAKEVCDLLGIKNSRDVISRLDEDEKDTVAINDGTPGNPNKTIVSESGLYSLIFKSRKEEAKKFRKWVTSEVIPNLRKSGVYRVTENIPDFMNPVEAARAWADQHEKFILAQNELISSAPKVQYFDKVLETKNSVPITIIAKELGISARKLNEFLKDSRVQYRVSNNWVLYSDYQNEGFTDTKTYTYTASDGKEYSSIALQWTQKGRKFIHDLYKGAQ